MLFAPSLTSRSLMEFLYGPGLTFTIGAGAPFEGAGELLRSGVVAMLSSLRVRLEQRGGSVVTVRLPMCTSRTIRVVM
ncbi:hypothetical protein AWI43_33140 [Streptomyces sp. WAC04657]|uniref:Uncharacterized protein n=1 Tax=Streptomyces cinereoruber TaxID=67260 RepID=A0ABX6B6M0_9ACTN|nr:hypothetical protein AWI43_33140 [Streptomyces sp. WAC04657]QEV30947.1 hypothetical protein CP977_01030 [Streptomyces cinereoruber]